MFTWKNSNLGGGGYITGIVQNPNNRNIIYARCDVAGVFRSTDRGKSWQCINNGMAACHDHSVQSMAISPHNDLLLFRCSGEARGNEMIGSIHKSIDGGNTWTLVSEDVDFYGNGPTRMYGEVIEVDPFQPQTVIAGGYSRGLWVSQDEGIRWTCQGLVGERIGFVHFHPNQRGLVYASTIGDSAICDGWDYEKKGTLNNFLTLLQDTPRGRNGNLYMSNDSGTTWSLIYKRCDMVELAFHPNDPSILLAADIGRGILKSEDFGESWNECGVGLDNHLIIGTLTADPLNPGCFYAAAHVRPHHKDAPSIAIYRTDNCGADWCLINLHNEDDLYDYPDYMNVRWAGWAISKVIVDKEFSNRLYMSNWYGVAVSEDRGLTWNANGFRGTETICAESVYIHPTNHKVFVTLADYTPVISSDGGVSYKSTSFAADRHPASNGIVASRHDESFMMYGIVGDENKFGCMVRSKDGGITGEIVKEWDKGLFVQVLAEDSQHPGSFYALIEGKLKQGAGIYRTSDWGESWNRINDPFTSEIETLPHQAYWIENELLSVVVYQTKNACGTNQLLAVDPHHANTLYVGERTEGLFVTRNCGNSWIRVEGLPFHNHRASVLNLIKADEEREGWLYAGFIREGLWRSKDGGVSWNKLFPLDDRIFNASSVAVRDREMVIACEPLYWSNSPSSVWYSQDLGDTWCDITDPSLGALRWKGIGFDTNTDLHIIGATCGNGLYIAQINK
ncbi:hypothetical protein ACFPPD_22790 [Cohnella suwonensis]|uniref:Glycosyl hydrolase n=1 Tax=Cohnella suwonensis TaxID=696072 RepID=A0ABW0M1T8_9BACL